MVEIRRVKKVAAIDYGNIKRTCNWPICGGYCSYAARNASKLV